MLILLFINFSKEIRNIVMKIGIPKEIKIHEYRVGLIPASVRELTQVGHEVFVESSAGLGVGCSDDAYLVTI